MTEKTVKKRKAEKTAKGEQGLESSWIYFVLIVMFCSNLFGRGSLLCLLFAVFALLRMRDKMVIDGMGVVVLLFSAVSLIASFAYEGVVEAVKCLNFVFMYLIGLNGYYTAVDKKKYLERLFLSIFGGYALYVVLIILWNINVEPVNGQRLIVNIWNDEYISVTLVGLLCSVIIGYFFYAAFLNKKKIIKLLAIGGIAAMISVNSQTATRTPVILLIIITSIMSALYLFDQNAKQAVRTIAFVLVLVVILALIYNTNVLGVKDMVEDTPIYQRFMEEGTDTRRTDLIFEHMKYMLDYPFGGSNIEKVVGSHSHNILQQGYDLYGAGAFLLLLFICGSLIKNLIEFFRLKKREPFDYLFIAMYISMFIQAFLEPIFTGYPCFFFSFLMIHGTAVAYLKREKGIGVPK